MTESTFRKVIGAVLVVFFLFVSWSNASRAEKSIYHEIYYPKGDGQFPALIILHTSGGFNTVKNKIERYVQAGYAVYAPDFFKRHKLSSKNGFDTFKKYRNSIESELSDIIEVMKKDNRVDKKNIFAVGYSNGGFWASFLAAEGKVNAGVSYYGVWIYPSHDGYPAKYFSINTSSDSATVSSIFSRHSLAVEIKFSGISTS